LRLLTNRTADAGSAVPFIMRKERHEIPDIFTDFGHRIALSSRRNIARQRV